MVNKTFLHPSQRSLKTEQIGPSGHKNQYHVGVLDGNWNEERHGFGPQQHRAASGGGFMATTTHRVSYVDTDSDTRRNAKPAEACSFEAPRELLFSHGHGHVASQYSVAELSYQGAKPDTAMTHKEIISVEGVSPRRSRSNAKKSESSFGFPESEDATATGTTSTRSDCRTIGSDGAVRYHLPPIGVALTRDRFTTSKNVTIDTTGMYLKENLKDVFEGSQHSKSRGDFLRSLNAVMHNTHLRY